MESLRCRKEQREYRRLDHSSQNTTKLGKQGPRLSARVICEDMRVVSRDDDEWSPWPRGQIQYVLWVYKPTQPFSCLFDRFALKNGMGRGLVTCRLLFFAVIHILEGCVILRKLMVTITSSPLWPSQLPRCRTLTDKHLKLWLTDRLS